jgi:RNA polymerase sigma-70 factor, ECF subfamily
MAPEGDLRNGPDRALVTAFQAGQDRAFDEIFRRYHGRVSAVCFRMLRSPQDAEEATQETFLKAYQALGRFNGNFYLGAWLSRIATNVCVDQLRSRSRTNLVALPDEPDDLVTVKGPEEIVAGGLPRMDRAIRQIQPLHASALALRAVQGLSHQEIAGRLRMTPTQVKALLHRARGSLRKAWDKAEGWAVAPMLGFRFLMSERTTEAGRVASLTPSAAPFLIERVAASAMIVAAALSGLPSSPDTGVAPERSRVRTIAPNAVPEDFEWAAGAPDQRGARTSAEIAAEPAPEAEEAAPEDPTTALTDDLKKALKDRPRPQDPRPRPNEGEGSPLGPHSAEGDRVVGEVRRVVNDAEESLTP